MRPSASFAEGKALPGPAADERWYDLAFALPGGAKESYLEVKLPLAEEALRHHRTTVGGALIWQVMAQPPNSLIPQRRIAAPDG